MKKILILLIPIFTYSQSNFDKAIEFQNTLKTYYILKQQTMRNLILFLLPFIGFSQDYNDSVTFLNTVRTYFDLPKLTVNKELSAKAQIKAEESAKLDEFIHFYNDDHGEMMYRIPQDMVEENRDYVLDACIGLSLRRI